MAAPTIYRSTDTNAPQLYGQTGSLRALLDACLVNGYGSTKATGTITSNGTNVSDGDTVTLDGIVYTFKTALTPTAGQVLIGASAAASLANLAAAMWGFGTVATTYAAGVTHQSKTQNTAITATVLSIQALRGGTGGNSITLAKSAATLTVSNTTLTGGSGSDTTTSLGWTSPYTGAQSNGAVYKQPAGSGMYLQVDDSNFSGAASGWAGLARDAVHWGFETMTAYNTGTGQFPTAAQVASPFTAQAIRKSSTVDQTARTWLLIGDDRTFYLFVLTGDAAANYVGWGFGDFYSYNVGDPYKCALFGCVSSTASALSVGHFGTLYYGFASGQPSPQGGHFLPRNYSGLGGSTAFAKIGDMATVPIASTTANALQGSLFFPNLSDGGLYLSPVRIVDGSTPGTTVAGQLNLRGRMRGFWHQVHPNANFADGDTFTGAGDFAGRNFLMFKYLLSNAGSNNGVAVVETTAWDTSA